MTRKNLVDVSKIAVDADERKDVVGSRVELHGAVHVLCGLKILPPPLQNILVLRSDSKMMSK